MIAASCLFCELQTNARLRIVEENELAYAIRDGFPVTLHHTLVIPKRHVVDYFGLNEAELLAMNQLLISQKSVIENLDPNVTGINVGAN
jgi:ATP adenylyltransferase